MRKQLHGIITVLSLINPAIRAMFERAVAGLSQLILNRKKVT